ncbi:uncharacterized protein LOC123211263 isoform X2 [Mangifera indica]|uniref:uncharacterized protein LOC123211263 isoform X2 n=1 Tax=Mangifera indica TaxID=29780 RepID=UPI001CFA1BC2|nr:uncharacterized protein LOC123211263 isoform X2 [Mangifera indica]
MAAPDSSTIQTPLIQTQTPPLRQEDVEVDDTQLSKSLDRLETFLRFFGFCQYSFLSFSLSWICFLLLGVALPILIIQLTYCSNCEKYEIESFELEILISQSLVAVISLICVSHNLRKYGVRKFLFVDRQHGHLIQFRREYLQKIHVASIVELVGIVICLNAAAKITHRAQGLGSVASRWHASVTCSSNSVTQMGINSNGGSVEAANSSTSIPTSYSESDLESVEYVPMATNTQLASYMTMYHKRQAFVTYLQSNPGGVTIFGWTIDRVLINTIFFVEMSLVLFVLGKTITWTTK